VIVDLAPWTPVIVAIITALGVSIAGVAALRRSGSESDKAQAEAADALIGASGEVVRMLREQMVEMAGREAGREARLVALEVTVGSWEGWGERILALLDRALGMLEAEQRAKLDAEAEAVKAARPMRYRGDAQSGRSPATDPGGK
jgi:hypothetical protein